MTTCLDIINRALRHQGVLSAGQVASGDDAADGLEHLQDVIDGLPLLRNGGLKEVVLSSAAPYAAADGDRVHTRGLAASIVLPTGPLEDLARVQVIGGAQAGLHVYSASTGVWAQADDLGLTDDSPFGPEDDAGLAALTALSMVDEYGGQVSDSIVGRAAAAIASFRARFYRETNVPAPDAVLVMSEMGEWR